MIAGPPGGPAIVSGGGLFTSTPAALDHIAIRGNSPGNCSGC
jgi:hypothetical protein